MSDFQTKYEEIFEKNNQGPIYKIPKKRKKKRLGISKTSNIESMAKRDGGRMCKACGSTDNLTVDHIIPLAKRGKNNMANKQILCRVCNGAKGNLLPGKNGWWPDSIPLPPNSAPVIWNAAKQEYQRIKSNN